MLASQGTVLGSWVCFAMVSMTINSSQNHPFYRIYVHHLPPVFHAGMGQMVQQELVRQDWVRHSGPFWHGFFDWMLLLTPPT